MIFAAIFLHEMMNGRMILGCVLIVLSIVLAQLDLVGLIKRRNEKKHAETTV